MKPRTQLSNMTTRQKVTAGLFVLILLFLIYQVYAMLGGGGGQTKPTPPPTAHVAPAGPAPNIPHPTPIPVPQGAAQIPKPTPVMSPREMELLRLQQETENKYIAALNELQMLRIEQQIAETTKAIMAAKLDTITSQKGIVDLLKPPEPPRITQTGYAQGLVTPMPSGSAVVPTPPTAPTIIQAPSAPPTTVVTTTTKTQPEIAYTVISVSQLQGHWNAVMGFQGSLYNVHIGDFLPPDQSKVIAIDRSGVLVERNGIKRKISLVPII